jgi:DNA mismatch repair protein MutS
MGDPPGILFPPDEPRPPLQREPPPCYRDLLLDQVVDAMTAGREEYDLRPWFSTPLTSAKAVVFRQDVVRDLEAPSLLREVTAFASAMRTIRTGLSHAAKATYDRQRERWVLDAICQYCEAVRRLARGLSDTPLCSRGLLAFVDHLRAYIASPAFRLLAEEAETLRQRLVSLRYAVLLRGLRVDVRPYAGEPDYSQEVVRTFQRFQQAEAREYRFTFPDGSEMNHVEARILDGVAALHADLFSQIYAFCTAHRDFLDPGVVAFDREVQFYVAYLEFIAPLRRAGLSFCYPRVSETSKEVRACEVFDLALAHKLVRQGALPVCNDVSLQDPERILVVTGPNQGGKTTFARAVGQLHVLASLGLPVPGREAHLPCPDRVFTHFQREELTTDLRGRLEDDLLRIREILRAATPRSIVIINEIFSSTTFQDALTLSQRIASALLERDALCVWVTFLDELSRLGEQTVSMVALVSPDDPEKRTYRVVRQPADGLAYALALARKYGLTYEQLRERLRP